MYEKRKEYTRKQIVYLANIYWKKIPDEVKIYINKNNGLCKFEKDSLQIFECKNDDTNPDLKVVVLLSVLEKGLLEYITKKYNKSFKMNYIESVKLSEIFKEDVKYLLCDGGGSGSVTEILFLMNNLKYAETEVLGKINMTTFTAEINDKMTNFNKVVTESIKPKEINKKCSQYLNNHESSEDIKNLLTMPTRIKKEYCDRQQYNIVATRIDTIIQNIDNDNDQCTKELKEIKNKIKHNCLYQILYDDEGQLFNFSYYTKYYNKNKFNGYLAVHTSDSHNKRIKEVADNILDILHKNINNKNNTTFDIKLKKAPKFAFEYDKKQCYLLGDAAYTTHFFTGTGLNMGLTHAEIILSMHKKEFDMDSYNYLLNAAQTKLLANIKKILRNTNAIIENCNKKHTDIELFADCLKSSSHAIDNYGDHVLEPVTSQSSPFVLDENFTTTVNTINKKLYYDAPDYQHKYLKYKAKYLSSK